LNISGTDLSRCAYIASTRRGPETVATCVECGEKYPFIPEQMVCHACDLEAMGFHVNRLATVLHNRSATVSRYPNNPDVREEEE